MIGKSWMKLDFAYPLHFLSHDLITEGERVGQMTRYEEKLANERKSRQSAEVKEEGPVKLVDAWYHSWYDKANTI